MRCEECQEISNKYIYIGGHSYCTGCVDKFKLIKCSTTNCNFITSLNGYDGAYDEDDTTCDNCNMIVCYNCITVMSNSKYCITCTSEGNNNSDDDLLSE
jgi:hypothetical protein